MGLTGTVTLQWGDAGAAPIATNLEYEGEFVLLRNSPQLDGNKWVHDCLFKPTGSAGVAWGTMS
jgi:hypothetical protein